MNPHYLSPYHWPQDKPEFAKAIQFSERRPKEPTWKGDIAKVRLCRGEAFQTTLGGTGIRRLGR